MSVPVAISLHSVSRFETGAENPILNAVSAEFKKGQLIALVGADGAGKTTLMRVMSGLLKPQEGSVQFFGRELYTQELNQLQALCGYMPQQFGLYTDLSVGENLTLYADLFGLSDIERKNRFEQLLKMTGLSAFTDRPAGKLSGGMKQKLGLACALLNRPQILLLDEPTVGVDPLSRKELWTILKDSVKSGDMTIVVATTYMDEASLCDDVVIMENGEVVLHDSPEAIARLAQGLCFNLLVPRGEKMRELQALLLDDIEEVLDAVPRAGKIRLLLKEASDREAIEKKYAVRLDWAQAGLEEGYLFNRYRGRALRYYSPIH